MQVIIVICAILCYLESASVALSLRDKKYFPESELLEALQIKSNRKTGSFHEPPQYMLDLYNEIADMDGVTKRPLPYQANVARAMTTIGDIHNEFKFSLAAVPSDENILQAEFHIFNHQLKGRQRKMNLPNNMFKLRLFYETESGPVLISSHELGNHAFGWRIFSVGQIIKKVRSEKGSSVNFSFKAETNDGVPLLLDIYHTAFGQKAPLLVMFNTNNNSSSSQLLFPGLVNDSEEKATSRSKRAISEDYADNSIDVTHSKLDGCELSPMKVNFQDIGWASWIVYPTEYNAHQCIGGCEFPLGQDLNPTNHATVQSILHFSKTRLGVQHPSCVPTSYTSLTLLYYDEDENVVLKQFDHMIATSCGCR